MSIKKTYNSNKSLISNFSNVLGSSQWELKSLKNFTKEPYPKLCELLGYLFLHHKEYIGVQGSYFEIKITIENLRSIIENGFKYQWNNFKRDLFTLYRTHEPIELYNPTTNKIMSIVPIVLVEVIKENRVLNKNEINDFDKWEAITLIYSRKIFDKHYRELEQTFTLPTQYYSYLQHYTKTLINLTNNYIYTQELVKDVSKIKNITASKCYGIINYLLDTDNQSKDKVIKNRSIDLIELSKRIDKYWIKKNKDGSIKSLRYNDIQIAIIQTLYISNCILLSTKTIENKFIKIKYDIASLEIDKPNKKAYIKLFTNTELKQSQSILITEYLLNNNLDELKINYSNKRKLTNRIEKLKPKLNKDKLNNLYQNRECKKLINDISNTFLQSINTVIPNE